MTFLYILLTIFILLDVGMIVVTVWSTKIRRKSKEMEVQALQELSKEYREFRELLEKK